MTVIAPADSYGNSDHPAWNTGRGVVDSDRASVLADVLGRIRGPRDLDPLSREELNALAAETRAFLVDKVSASGGHLGPNLGVVELTIALHRVFDSPRDALIFDTGHQAYVHKILTGRQDGFDRLRASGGSAAPPSPDGCESCCVAACSSDGGSSGSGSSIGRPSRSIQGALG